MASAGELNVTYSRYLLNSQIKEKDFQASVRQLAALDGWQEYCTYRSDRSPEGFPDLTLVRPPRIVFAELKTMKGKLTDAQKVWQDLLLRCPSVEYYLWRPSDWDWIERALKRAP